MTTEEFKNKVIPFSRKLYPMIKGILRDEEETRDALQDLMLKLWDKRKSLDECLNLEAYIVSIAKNYCFDLLKKKKPGRIKTIDELKIRNIEADEKNHDTTEKHEYVLKIIENLPGKYREVIRLRDIDGFEFEEISAMMEIEVPHIRVILSRARMRVKSELLKIYAYENKTYRRAVGQVL